jgi:hypothetical protein
MNLNEFTKKVQQEIQRVLGSEYLVEISSVNKNNGISYEGIYISEKNSEIAPCIYMEYYFERYKMGQVFDDIIQLILSNYKHAQIEVFDVKSFIDFDRVKDKIVSKIINSERNQEVLDIVPHTDFLDWSIVYYVMIPAGVHEGTILIKNSHLEIWGVNLNTLEELACLNNQILLPVEVKGMEEIISNILSASNCNEGEDNWDEDIMIIASNSKHLFGANTILYDGVLNKIALKKELDLYIIPSSIHETIIVPDDGKVDLKYLQEMVMDVNKNVVELEEFLSDHVYKYIRKTGEIIIAM